MYGRLASCMHVAHIPTYLCCSLVCVLHPHLSCFHNFSHLPPFRNSGQPLGRIVGAPSPCLPPPRYSGTVGHVCLTIPCSRLRAELAFSPLPSLSIFQRRCSVEREFTAGVEIMHFSTQDVTKTLQKVGSILFTLCLLYTSPSPRD